MNVFTTISRGLRSLGQSGDEKREIDEELRFHVEQRTAENRAAGMTESEAAREARKRFGSFQSIREQCREARGAGFGETLIQDIQFGARMLRKDRGFTFVAVVTLALGIGANTSLFSLLNLLLFRPGPYPHPERLVRVFRTSPQSQTWPHSPADLTDHRDQNKSFERMAFFWWQSMNLAEAGEPAEGAVAVLASADIFPTMGLPPALGRVFTQEEDVPDNRVIVLGYSFWRRRFGADTNIIGRTLRLDGNSFEVIGVMPADFESHLWNAVDLWRPLGLTPEQRQDRGNHFLHAFGRLKPGVSMASAEAELKSICVRLPNTGHDSIRLAPLVRSGYNELGQRMVYFTFGLAGLVLLIACANLANLQLARATGRWREFSVRAALGASRARLMRQLFTESLVVSLLGGGLGMVLAKSCKGIVGHHVPYMGSLDLPLDGRVFAFALGSALLTGIVFGTAPAWLASRSDVNDALKANRRGATAGPWHNLLRQGLIIGELALALSLLAGAGLFIRRLHQLARIEPGWRVDGVLTGQIALSSSRYESTGGRIQEAALYQQLEERLCAIPGVENASLSWSLPIWDFTTSGNFTIDGQPPPKSGEAPLADKDSVTPAYFRTMGIELQRGRAFTAEDTAQSPAVAVINETMARRFWPGQDPIGKRIQADGVPEIIGVVRDVRSPGSLGVVDTPYQIYRPLAQLPSRFLCIALRTTGPGASLTSGMRRAVAALDPDVAVRGIQTARQAVDRSLADVSLMGALLAAFAALGLALAALGIYGVTSYAVAQRTAEFGVRMALGAQRRQILLLVLRQGVSLCGLGTILGVCGAFGTAAMLSALLPELSARDPATFAITTALLVAVALLASFIPARRATRLDPMTALRYE
jgi:predicted permease